MTTMKAGDPHGVGAESLRREEPGWTLGELMRPGMLIQAGPGHCPYLVERITRTEFEGWVSWSLTGWSAYDGVAVRDEHHRWWLNEQVAVRYAPAPLGFIIRPIGIYDYDCPARDCMFIVIGESSVQNRAGQLGLML
jgi:hypothetical protein